MAGKAWAAACVAAPLLTSTGIACAKVTITFAESGIASVYADELTANGEWAFAAGMTAAHKTLPFGTRVKVTNKKTGMSVVVRINDRGPYVEGRIIDLTPAAAQAIGSDGLAHVEIAVVGQNGQPG
jgi:rare lipoprotein A